MGSVWVAEDVQLGREVAIKVMIPAAFALPDLVARFEREARAAAQIRSAHVVQIFDHGFDGNQPFIVMELLHGEDLAARLSRVGRLSIDETVRIVCDVCRALRPAHEIGVVHRDLKPANIFLARQDDGEVTKVLDFGVAKLTGSHAEMTQGPALLGTPHYMAPEQARDTGAPVDHRADLWSLSVIAFRALTGQLPFAGETPVMVLVAVASQAVPAPSTFAPDLGFEVDRFFAKALARDRSARFQSAQELRDAISRMGSRLSLADGRLSRPSDIGLPPPGEGTQTIDLTAAASGQPASPLPFIPSGSPQQALSPLRTTLPLRTTMPLPAAAARSGETLSLSGASQIAAARPEAQIHASVPAVSPGSGVVPSGFTSEPTPAVMASTRSAIPAPKVGRSWVVWMVAVAAVLAMGVVVAAVLSQSGASPPGAAASAVAVSARPEPTLPATTTGAPTVRAVPEPSAPTVLPMIAATPSASASPPIAPSSSVGKQGPATPASSGSGTAPVSSPRLPGTSRPAGSAAKKPSFIDPDD